MSFLSQNQRMPCKEFAANIAQVAGTYDICTASGGGIYIENVVVYVTTAAATLTSVSIQTNQTNPTTVMSSVEGAVANLISQKNIVLALARPIYLADGQKLQFTITGATGTGALLVVTKYYPTNSSSDLV